MNGEVGLDDHGQVGVIAAASTGVDVMAHPRGRFVGELAVDEGVEQVPMAQVGDHVGESHLM